MVVWTRTCELTDLLRTQVDSAEDVSLLIPYCLAEDAPANMPQVRKNSSLNHAGMYDAYLSCLNAIWVCDPAGKRR